MDPLKWINTEVNIVHQDGVPKIINSSCLEVYVQGSYYGPLL
jgi:hypothetical protein